jgi:hypothetical protein
MMSARCLPVPAIAWILTAPLTMMAVGQEPQVSTPDSGPPTAIEQALIERSCRATFTDAHQVCLSSQLNSLRADFGRDLTRLSGAERRALDSACNRIRTEQGREGYLDCLGAQLVALRNRRPASAATDAPAIPRPTMRVPSANPAPPAGQVSSVSGVWMAAALVTLFVVAGGALLAVKARRAAPRKCLVCGEDAREAGDLCQKCHEAAEASRRAAAERADHKRAQQEELRRRREEEEEQRRRINARQEEEARLQQEEEARQREENARQREEEDVRRRSQVAVASDDVFDAYAVLGVPKDASKEAIRTAYLEARSKYDLDHVSHMGAELQEHYQAKARAVDRAYQMLTK